MYLDKVRGKASRFGRTASLAFTLVIATPLAACSDESRLTVNTSTGDFTFNVEVVDTPESRAQGLMYRENLADDAGMLFDFKGEQRVSFWMMNTLIPLDMIFIGADGVVRNVHVNARPQDPTSIPSDGPVQFVLEIPGGRSEEIGLEAGDTVEHTRIPATDP
ncbi:hypothetical protein GCM10007989_00390 [Devosia pacifica]|uniref:DUF192 domain-containing protein n=1 Tax=Devosia pacifica TaxID=1335967 RepID=A0A918RT46_9HYPH|nr:DUF192 domain-containing protein [Devosia pacifica]GHA10205.1 hypothetical protein GCM10007989_00390 [Devosia pacifica]